MMARSLLKLAVLAAALAGAASASAGIDDCEKIKEPDAYNRCLASFGPARGARAKPAPGEKGANPEHVGRRYSQPSRSGRMRATFRPKTSADGRVRMMFTPRER
jgi:hypothetical protein